MDRRGFLSTVPVVALATLARPESASAQHKPFAPTPGTWRTFEVTTRVEVFKPAGVTKVWIPVPAVDDSYQKSLEHQWTGNATNARLLADRKYGADMLYAEFAEGTQPVVELTSRIQAQDRSTDWSRRAAATTPLDAATQKFWTDATELMPTDGIVRATALEVTKGKRTDVEKVQALYDWVVANTFREPNVRGCGVGDIKSMLETGNMGGKCGDINALFVGLSRAAGVPARDVYGIRVAKSAFGYKELGAGPNITRAQHCRAEVFLRGYGWVAMDPADVGKVMRLETAQWIRDVAHPVVAPVHEKLFGGWEGNWLAYNVAHDVVLPNSTGPRLGFLMYPQAENANGRYDPLDPDTFKYTITSREITS